MKTKKHIYVILKKESGTFIRPVSSNNGFWENSWRGYPFKSWCDAFNFKKRVERDWDKKWGYEDMDRPELTTRRINLEE